MKIKYIFSMVAGLIVLVTTSCSEKKSTATDEAKAKSEETAEAKTPEAETTDTPETPSAPVVGAYYVMFKGDGG
jgi:PBP1b-binding outer membrane lipoprotein LpoB